MTFHTIKKVLILSLAASFAMFSSTAQNLKLSQYYNAPTFYNPANAGKIDGIARAGAIYSRQQADSSKLNHALVFADYSIKQKNGSLGVGLSYYQNFQKDFCLTGRFLSATVAKHILLDPQGKHQISLGAQVTLANGHIDASRKGYSAKISGGGFRLIGAPATNSASYADVNYGAMYTYRTSEILFETGVAAYHAFSPVNELNASEAHQDRRIDFSVNMVINVDEHSQVALSTLLWREGFRFIVDDPAVIEDTYNASFKRKFEKSAIVVGMGTRSLHSLIPSVGYNFSNNCCNVMVSYEKALNNTLYNVDRAECSLLFNF